MKDVNLTGGGGP